MRSAAKPIKKRLTIGIREQVELRSRGVGTRGGRCPGSHGGKPTCDRVKEWKQDQMTPFRGAKSMGIGHPSTEGVKELRAVVPKLG